MRKITLVLLTIFWITETYAQKDSLEVPSSFELRNSISSDSKFFFNNGLYIDGFSSMGLLFNYNYDRQANLVSPVVMGIGCRFGSKWYLKGKKKSKTGIQVEWLRTSVIGNFPTFNNFAFNISALSVGLTNVKKLKNGGSVELYLNAGFNLLISFMLYSNPNRDYQESITLVQPGFIINPGLKFVTGENVVLGIDFSYTVGIAGDAFFQNINGNKVSGYYTGNSFSGLLNFSAGGKF